MNDARRTEPDVVAARPVLLAAGSMVAILALALAVVAGGFMVWLGRPPFPPRAAKPPTYPAPALETDPRADLENWRKRQQRKLHEDAVLPIERAMAAVAARGDRAFAPLRPARPSDRRSDGGAAKGGER